LASLRGARYVGLAGLGKNAQFQGVIQNPGAESMGGVVLEHDIIPFLEKNPNKGGGGENPKPQFKQTGREPGKPSNFHFFSGT